MAPNVSQNIHNKRKVNPKNRQTKVHLIFDDKKRKDYLLGFRKRKAERKRKFNEKLKSDIKIERKRLQTELRAKISKSASSRCLPEIEHLVQDEAHVYELPEHTVTIEPISDSQFRGENLFLGNNESKPTTHTSGEDDKDTHQTLADKKKQLKDLNRTTIKKLQKTKAFRRQVQVSRDKSRKRARRISKKDKKNKKNKGR